MGARAAGLECDRDNGKKGVGKLLVPRPQISIFWGNWQHNSFDSLERVIRGFWGYEFVSRAILGNLSVVYEIRLVSTPPETSRFDDDDMVSDLTSWVWARFFSDRYHLPWAKEPKEGLSLLLSSTEQVCFSLFPSTA